MNKFVNGPSNIGYNDTRGIYAELDRLKNMSLQMPTYRTVFNDIADEWNKCTPEEQSFINNDEEYVKANLIYQQSFNSFLLELVGSQFLSSQYGKTAESVLLTMRKARDGYRQQADLTVRSIQEQNEMLKAEVAELKKLLE